MSTSMELIPVTKESESRQTFNQLRTIMLRGSQSFERIVGFPGGHIEGAVFWRLREGIWSYFDDTQEHNRFWCCYGIQNPDDQQSLNITIEINPPLQGFDRRIQG